MILCVILQIMNVKIYKFLIYIYIYIYIKESKYLYHKIVLLLKCSPLDEYIITSIEKNYKIKEKKPY
ncbi:MAG: hypothetical protein MCS20_01425, partial [Candidatus Phytoplasma mali]|nr:hypothetical protein [Candidatus Phytoplasma australiense]MCG7202057.1 hypothetical protein [Candidatus Phytoplasma mali]